MSAVEELLAAAVIGFAGGVVVADVYVFGPITQGLVDVLAAFAEIVCWPINHVRQLRRRRARSR